jgi:thymidine kinase
MAELVFFTGTMDSGKSTLALQLDHNHNARGRAGLIFTRDDRAGSATISSRLGLKAAAVEVTEATDLLNHVVQLMSGGGKVDYIVADEAQFYTEDHIEQLARVVDELSIDVYAFGITTDFRTRLFPGSQRLIELADRVEVLQVEALCWCGSRATHNARTVGGVMVVEGAQVVVGDVSTQEGEARSAPSKGGGGRREGEVGYEVLCRRHHTRRVTAATSGAGALSPDVLPFGNNDTVCSNAGA